MHFFVVNFDIIIIGFYSKQTAKLVTVYYFLFLLFFFVIAIHVGVTVC